jgi:hypothetical protein
MCAEQMEEAHAKLSSDAKYRAGALHDAAHAISGRSACLQQAASQVCLADCAPVSRPAIG